MARSTEAFGPNWKTEMMSLSKQQIFRVFPTAIFSPEEWTKEQIINQISEDEKARLAAAKPYWMAPRNPKQITIKIEF